MADIARPPEGEKVSGLQVHGDEKAHIVSMASRARKGFYRVDGGLGSPDTTLK